MRASIFKFIALSSALFGLNQGRAQSVHWEPPGGTLAISQESQIQLVFEDCKPESDPVLPRIDGLAMGPLGQTSSTNIINGHLSSSFIQAFGVRPTERNPVTIPSFAVETNKGKLTVPAAHFDVGDATIGQSNLALDKVASSVFNLPASVWVGEVFPLGYNLQVTRRYFYQVNPTLQWSPAPLLVEEWGKPEVSEGIVGGENRVSVAYRTRAYAKSPGQIKLAAASQMVLLVTGSSPFGLINRPNYEPYTITSNQAALSVRPLPDHPPAGFAGAVGHFQFDSKVVPDSVTVGEPITWTLTIDGTGNWPDIAGMPSREVSKDFRVVQPNAKRTPKEGALFDATLAEDVVLIPTKPGTYRLGPVVWSYFDPAKGEYQTVSSPAKTVIVTAPPTTPITENASSPNPGTAAAKSPLPSAAPVAPAAPSAIPRDPLLGTGEAHPPLTTESLLILIAAPWTLLVIFWGYLASRRAKATDPLRTEREARLRIGETVTSIVAAKDPQRLSSLLQSWQKDTAILFRLTQAVPAPSDLSLAQQKETPNHWPDLWRDAERSLYRAGTPLPADWPKRAREALEQKTVPAFSLWQLFRPRNLLPFAAVLFIALMLSPSRSFATEASVAYSQGNFTAAEKEWRTTVEKSPTDWISRHNLSLALAQQDHWDEAAAQATAAFVQHPQDPSDRWNFALVCSKSTYTPAILGAFNQPTPLHAVARLFSPTEWQYALVLASLLSVFALGCALWRFYEGKSFLATAAGILGVAAALLIGVAGLVSLHLYAATADARSAIVWRTTTLRSIPTEADTAQKTAPLAAGTVAVVGKSFLGWARLDFQNGQTGWVHADDLVHLWR